MVEAQCLCRSAWRKSDKSNKKRRASTESETQTPHLYHCFLSFWETLILSFKHVYACGPKTALTKLRFLSRWSLWWGGVGWVGDSNVPCTCTHFWCYATGCFSLTCTHVGCYVIDFPWSRTHVRCYASDGVGWGGLGTVTFLALAHIFDATQQDVSLWLAHTLDATSLTFLGLEHMWDATQVMRCKPIECRFFHGKMQNPLKSWPHFLQIFRQDNVCFAVAKITFFLEMLAPTSSVSGPPGCLCIRWTVESSKKGVKKSWDFSTRSTRKSDFHVFQLGPTPKTTPSGPVKPWKPRSKNAMHRWVAPVVLHVRKNKKIPLHPKTQVAPLNKFVKNSPTWNIWWQYWNLNVNSQAIVGERQGTKIRNPEPMLKDCTPPAALTLEKWHFGTSHLELASCRSVGGWKTVNKSKLTSH